MERKVGSRGIIMIRNKNKIDEIKHPLQKRRILAGLRQVDLADEIGRPVSYIGKIETGQININNITLANGYKLSKRLNCKMEDLLIKEDL